MYQHPQRAIRWYVIRSEQVSDILWEKIPSHDFSHKVVFSVGAMIKSMVLQQILEPLDTMGIKLFK